MFKSTGEFQSEAARGTEVIDKTSQTLNTFVSGFADERTALVTWRSKIIVFVILAVRQWASGGDELEDA